MFPVAEERQRHRAAPIHAAQVRVMNQILITFMQETQAKEAELKRQVEAETQSRQALQEEVRTLHAKVGGLEKEVQNLKVMVTGIIERMAGRSASHEANGRG